MLRPVSGVEGDGLLLLSDGNVLASKWDAAGAFEEAGEHAGGDGQQQAHCQREPCGE